MSRPSSKGPAAFVRRWAWIAIVGGAAGCSTPEGSDIVDRDAGGTQLVAGAGGAGAGGARAGGAGGGGAAGAAAGATSDAAADARGPESPLDAAVAPSADARGPEGAADAPAARDTAPVLGANGAACQKDGDCATGFCAQGLCCNSRCGAACEACNLGNSKGTCTYVTGKVCRAAADVCDRADECNGLSATCPPEDRKQPAGFECRAGGGLSNPAEACDGTRLTCPADVKLTNLVSNPEFDDMLVGWAPLNTSRATAAVDVEGALSGKNSLEIDLKMGGYFQSFRSIPGFVQGRRYNIAMMAKASSPIELEIGLSQTGSTSVSEHFEANATGKTFTASMPFAASSSGAAQLLVGTYGQSAQRDVFVWIDRVEIVQVP